MFTNFLYNTQAIQKYKVHTVKEATLYVLFTFKLNCIFVFDLT